MWRLSLVSVACSIVTIFIVLILLLLLEPTTLQYATDAPIDVTSSVPIPQKETPYDTVIFTGDVMLGRQVERIFFAHRTDYITSEIKSQFSSSTNVVINFESAMADPHISTPGGQMRFSTSLNSLALLKEIKVTHASLANNHSLDYGKAGYEHAKVTLLQNDIAPFGQSTVVSTTTVAYISHNNKTITLIGIHTLFTEPSAPTIQSIISEVSKKSDLQIAYVHWGDEYELVHNKNQENFARVLVDAGVDVIIGHHPHVTEDIGIINGVPVFYSLGNFIFDQYFSPEVTRGFNLAMTYHNDWVSFRLLPHTQSKPSVPRPMSDLEEIAYLNELAERSEPSLRSAIIDNSLSFKVKSTK